MAIITAVECPRGFCHKATHKDQELDFMWYSSHELL